MFKEVPTETFDEREKQVLALWKSQNTFNESLKIREKGTPFIVYDGPPFATGLPHYGHLLAGTIKDVVPRYKTMKGFSVPRRFGWDCHGLPIEQEIEKAKGLSGAATILAYGIAKFNEDCRSIVNRYTEEWKATVLRMGRWVDFDKTWHTMDKDFMESVWWVFKELYEKGLVYEGYKVMPFSAKLGSPLSNFEAGENYKEVDDPSVTVKFTLQDETRTSFLAWTTTPWTLVSNMALMVGKEVVYVKVNDFVRDESLILAKARLSHYYPDAANYEIVWEKRGEELVGLHYKPLFTYFANKESAGAFRVILGQDISTEDGTGIVHSAPAFGEADFYAAKEAGVPLVCPVDNNGLYTDEIPEYKGQFVKDADKDIIRRIKEAGKLFRQETLHHRYPFCYRSDTPLIYKAITTWFVAVEKIKEKLLQANKSIHWTPDYIKEGRFGKWLEGARDWAISRNRYWGTPIPIWRAESGDIHVVGSVAELEQLSGKKISDLHRHYIDDITFTKGGQLYKRIPEVFDCWFESGSMPYAQNHYPFENRELFEKSFPADFIAEGLDQTRCWFYVLTVLSAALFDRPAFKNVIVNGILLAEDGAKMSKRLKNYPEPAAVIEKFGADAIRLYMLDSPAARASDLAFSERGVEQVVRQVLLPLWNAYSFFITYARISGWKPKAHFVPKITLDRWMISRLHKLIEEVEEGMDQYDLTLAVKPFVGFVDQLTNWYIRRSRRRFWEEGPDSEDAFATLYQVLLELAKVAAPFIPFMAESIYQNLRAESMPASVHLADYPQFDHKLRDTLLEEEMEAVQTVVSLGHALRKDHQLKVRMPLPAVHVASADPHLFSLLKRHEELILDELNVKAIHFNPNESELVTLTVKPNFRTLGKKVGKKMRQVQEAVLQLKPSALDGEVKIVVEGEEILLSPEDLLLDRKVKEGMVAANVGAVTLLLDTALTEELEIEGLAREIVNKVNTMRREGGFQVTDRIILSIDTTDKVKKSFEKYGDTIRNEVLATEVIFGPTVGQEWDLNGERAIFSITKK